MTMVKLFGEKKKGQRYHAAHLPHTRRVSAELLVGRRWRQGGLGTVSCLNLGCPMHRESSAFCIRASGGEHNFPNASGSFLQESLWCA